MLSGPLMIPKKRVGVLIGKDGKAKRQLEELMGVKLSVTHEGLVDVTGKDALNVWKAKHMVLGIARGFNLSDVECLTDDEHTLIVVNLQDLLGKNEKTMERFKARIIGKDGRAKKRIEDETNTHLAVFGKTVSVVGRGDNVEDAREAIEMILDGKMHNTVFKFLELNRAKRDKF